MDNSIVTIIVAILSSGALSALINGFFQSRRDKRSKENGLESKVDALTQEISELRAADKKHEIDQIRSEMKMMIYNDPDKEDDLLRMGQHYFVDLGANWTMGKTYTQWLRSRNIKIPTWVKEE